MGRLDGRLSPRLPLKISSVAGGGGGGGAKKVTPATAVATAATASISSSSGTTGNAKMYSWTEWMENACGSGMELFGCDENCSAGRNVLHAALRLPNNDGSARDNLCGNLNDFRSSSANAGGGNNKPLRDYEALHDEFLESLIAEQTKLADSSHSSEDNILVAEPTPSGSGSPRPPPSYELRQSHQQQQISSSSSSRKRRRQMIKLQQQQQQQQQQQTTTTKRRPSSGSVSTKQSLRDSSNKSVEISLDQIAQLQLPTPNTYLHPLCRMQKDKGRGDDIGSNICAKGSEACLEKLRVKMRLLTEFVLDPNEQRGSATMKRKRAKIMHQYDNFIETRSIIELKMGFLSMTYGVLLRWDTSVTGKVTLVVLRKMCHDSFYPNPNKQLKKSSSFHGDPSATLMMSSSFASTSSTISTSDGMDFSLNTSSSSHNNNNNNNNSTNTAANNNSNNYHLQLLQQRVDGSEITQLDPPYRIARPAKFDPSFLLATVLHATGMNKRSLWTIKLSYDPEPSSQFKQQQQQQQSPSISILLAWDESLRCFVPSQSSISGGSIGDKESLSLPLTSSSSSSSNNNNHVLRCTLTSLHLSNLTIKLYEHRLRRKNHQRLLSTMSIPLQNLHAQPQHAAQPIRLMVPCQHDPQSTSIAIALTLCSDYLYWLQQELEARRQLQQQQDGSRSWRRKSSTSAIDEEDENDDFWDWICCIC